MKIEKFENIEAWKKGRELAKDIYAVTGKGKFARDYGLRDQIQRATVSIMANISEGFDANSDDEFVRFLRYAYISKDEFTQLYDQGTEVKKLISGFIRYLRH
jgi:four helix bundle protein